MENIPNAHFDLNVFIHSEPVKHEFSAEIKSNILRIQNLYMYADIKKSFYTNPELQEDESYKKLLESLMWINGQRLACITGMKQIHDKVILDIHVAKAKDFHATSIHAARALIQAAIGCFVDEELAALENRLSSIPAKEVVEQIKKKSTYQQFITVNDGNLASFQRYQPGMTKTGLIALIDEYLYASVHLAQSITPERNIITISKYVRHHYGINFSQTVLLNLENRNLDVNKFFMEHGKRKLADDMCELIRSVNLFYVYAAVKKEDNFFDKEDKQGQRLLEAEMWVNLQRRRCIEGMSLISSQAVYHGEQIQLTQLDQSLVITEDNAKSLAKTPSISSAPTTTTTAQFLPIRGAALRPLPVSSSSFSHAEELQDASIGDDAALDLAIKLSLEEHERSGQRENTSIRSNPEQRNQQLCEAPSSGDFHGVVELMEVAQHQNTHHLAKLNDEFIQYAALGDIDNLKRLIEQLKVPIDIFGQNQQTALMAAAATGQLTTAQWLLERGAKINLAQPNSGYKAIHFAAMQKREDVMALLIAKGADPLEIVQYQNAHRLAELNDKLIQYAALGDISNLQRLIEKLKVPIDMFGHNQQTALIDMLRQNQQTALMAAARDGGCQGGEHRDAPP